MIVADWIEPGELLAEAQGPFSPEMVHGAEGRETVYSRRFTLELGNGLHLVADVCATASPLEFPSDGMEEGLCDVATCTVFTVCTDPADPGSTEVQSPLGDYEWGYWGDRALPFDQADDTARGYVATFDATQYLFNPTAGGEAVTAYILTPTGTTAAVRAAVARDTLTERVYDGLMAAGQRALADEYAAANRDDGPMARYTRALAMVDAHMATQNRALSASESRRLIRLLKGWEE